MSATIPLRLAVDIRSPDGTTHNRWGPDEPNPADVPTALTFSTTMPGGFEQLSCTLARKPSVDYSDLGEFSIITVYGVGGETAWQGRLETTPRVSGDQIAISPGAVGWQAALDDDQSAREIYQDMDLTQWTGPSIGRQLVFIGASYTWEAPNVSADPTNGNPALMTALTGPWLGTHTCEATYNSNGIPLGGIYAAWKQNGTLNAADTNWVWIAAVFDNDLIGSGDVSGNLRAVGPGIVWTPATTGTRRIGLVEVTYANTGVSAGTLSQVYAIYWTCLAVVGNHGVPINAATQGATNHGGLLASDIVINAVSRWAPTLRLVDTGGSSTVTPTSFLIPHSVYKDPTTAGNIVKDVTKYELSDWAVWEGPTFWMAPRNTLGRSWRARVGPSGLSETGPQVDRIYNAVVVTYTDITGAILTVGPTGTSSNATDDSLRDSDPSNPATLAGLTRVFELPNIGVSVLGAATQIGQAFLVEQKAISTAGQASIVGVVQDSSGVTWPAWMIRAGDNITFVDAHDPVPRRIVKTTYTDDTKTNQLDLDSPPEGLQALLARLTVTDSALGF